MAVLITGNSFTTADQVTATTLNNIANAATFASGAIDGSTTQLSGGAIIVKDLGITAAKLESGSNGQLMVGTGTGFTKATLTAAGGIVITNASGAITISNGTQYSYVSSDFSKTSDINAASITGLTATLEASGIYGFRAVCFITCAAAGGYYFDFNGGTATATTFRADGISFDQGTLRSQVQVTALSSAIYNTAGSAIAPIKMVVDGTIVVNGAGTLIPRFAQASSSGTPSVVTIGSRMTAWKIA
jgi:hypothetical protein